jgi:hypothetical protein
MTVFEKVSNEYLKILENCSSNVKKCIIQKVIHRIEIGANTLKIFWNLNGSFYENEVELLNDNYKQSTPAASAGVLLKENIVGVSSSLTNGVTDGARTRDKRNHNPLLYQLNYSHHNSSFDYGRS